MSKITLFVCTNHRYSSKYPSCGVRGSEKLLQQLQIATLDFFKEGNVNVEASCCFGQCMNGVVVKIVPHGNFYYHVTELDISKLMSDTEALTDHNFSF